MLPYYRSWLLAGICAAAIGATVSVDVSAAVDRFFVIQPIEICNDDGSNCSNVTEESYDFTRTTWESIGIGAVFLETKQFNNTALQRIESSVQACVNTGGTPSFVGVVTCAAGNQAAGGRVLNMWLTNETVAAPGFINFGEAFLNRQESIINAGAVVARGRIDTVAHELGHNIGLPHTPGEPPGNLMTAGSFRNSPATAFTADEIAAALVGFGVNVGAPPEIQVEGNGVVIADNTTTFSTGNNTDMGSTAQGTPHSKTFSIREIDGNFDLFISSLTISDTTNFLLVGADADGTLDVPKGGSKFFTVHCLGLTLGTFTATVTVKNNDPDDREFVYNFDVKCVVTLEAAGPEPAATSETTTGIFVFGNGSAIGNGATGTSAGNFTDFGSTPQGTPLSRTFVLSSTETRTIQSISVANPITFAVTSSPSSVNAGSSAQFAIRCTANTPGTFSTLVTIAHGIPPEDDGTPFTFTVRCEVTGTGATTTSEISVAVRNPFVRRALTVNRIVLTKRGRNICRSEPPLANRLSYGGERDLPGFVSVGGDFVHDGRIELASSLADIKNYTKSRKREKTQNAAAGAKDRLLLDRKAGNVPDFDVWVKGSWARQDNGSARTEFAIAYLGADTKIDKHLTVGWVAQYEHSDLDDSALGFSVDGDGWLSGPYFVSKISDSLYVDGRVAFGTGDNDIQPLPGQNDSYDSKRRLFRLRFTGEYKYGEFVVEPEVGVVRYEETQESYTDSLGFFVPQSEVSVSRLQFGPSVRTSISLRHGLTLEPSLGVMGIYEDVTSDLDNLATPGLSNIDDEGLRAQVRGSLQLKLPDDQRFIVDGFYDGIGLNDESAYGFSLQYRRRF